MGLLENGKSCGGRPVASRGLAVGSGEVTFQTGPAERGRGWGNADMSLQRGPGQEEASFQGVLFLMEGKVMSCVSLQGSESRDLP